MKKLKKLLIAFLCVFMTSTALTGCSSLPKTSSQTETEAVTKIREEDIKDIAKYTQDNFASLLTSATYDEFKSYVDGGHVVVSKIFDNDFGYRWKQFVDKHGQVKKAKVDQTQRSKTDYTSRILLTGEDGGEMAMTITYDETMRPVSTTISDYSDDSKLTLGQKMETAAANTATGLIVVFVVLAFLIFVISLFNFIPKPSSGKKKPEETKKAPAPKPAPAAAPAETESTPEEDLTKDEELVAVITAAIAASEDKPVEGYVVRSIKRLHTNKWH